MVKHTSKSVFDHFETLCIKGLILLKTHRIQLLMQGYNCSLVTRIKEQINEHKGYNLKKLIREATIKTHYLE